jgi:hypothetical protein
MFAMAILFASTLLEETSETLGKNGVKKRRESIVNLAFLTQFWSVIFLLFSTLLGAKLVLNAHSLPILAIRVIVEVFLNYTAALAIVRADRSTIGFMRLLTIPLLLASDVTLGYHISSLQIAGVCVLFVGLAAAFYHNPHGQRGANLGILVAVFASMSAAMYKWDITHYNSVAAEQIVVYSCVTVFFYFMSLREGSSPLQLLLRPATGTQSLANGLGLAIESFAWVFAPASVIVAIKRALAVMWSIIFGQHYFRERHVRQKFYAGAVLVVGLFLLISPYW